MVSISVVHDEYKNNEFFDWNSYIRCKKQFVSTYSRNQWREICMSNVPNYFKNIGYSNSDIASAFEIIEDIMLEIDEKSLPRDIMTEFVVLFII